MMQILLLLHDIEEPTFPLTEGHPVYCLLLVLFAFAIVFLILFIYRRGLKHRLKQKVSSNHARQSARQRLDSACILLNEYSIHRKIELDKLLDSDLLNKLNRARFSESKVTDTEADVLIKKLMNTVG